MRKYWFLFLMSMLPISELRGSLILAAAQDVPLYLAYPLCVLGNLLPVPFILYLFEWALNFFSRRRFIGPLLQTFWARAERKAETIGKYKLLGVYLFVAIPLPLTGAWTGSLVAMVLKVKRHQALMAIFAGILTAGAIMSILFYLLPDVFNALFH